MSENYPTQEKHLREHIDSLVAFLRHRATPGLLAKLRRDGASLTPSLSFYRLAAEVLPSGWERHHKEWVAIVAAVALAGPSAQSPHVRLGRALRNAGFSELRLERVLGLPDDLVPEGTLSLARFLAAKDQHFDFLDLARFALTSNPEGKEKIRRLIALSFYQHSEPASA